MYGAQFHHMLNNVRQKRNTGIALAQYPIVLFIDSDCVADEDLLNEHARIYLENDTINLGGVVGLTQFVGKENWVWKVIQHSSTLDAFSYPKHHRVVPWGPTCNISYWRRVIDEVGSFDISFPFTLGGDDTDLGLRVTDAGYLLITNVKAIVYHERQTWNSVPAIFQRRFRWGRMHYYLLRKHSHRVSLDPPNTPFIFLLLLLFFLPFIFAHDLEIWSSLPFIWLALELLIETILISNKFGSKLTDFLYSLGASVLTITFQFGSTLEGIINRSLKPLYQEVNYCPPSPFGRHRGILQLWAKVLALLFATWFIVFVQFL